ncbi:hypothetical protein TWF225_000739 [Orbilia oligospora]|uniref:Uncharacterized protein n=1 Tax=Orbilia oligospora TaxID=2813651 RepID=A0A8H2E4H3_ORBOL|nr:hypothetical protein TWF225_000739 [Orbilia oligospora]KAF3244795.1 hypothetical protein TWF217_010636 [Orbilia oligospora]KAF3247012.1 hypothetical protein TWF128_012100 [Orbilia oligospora]KAF3281354.1 hypothetical protein TWF132_011242 [Orbilia oligospora]TGJ71651.1 hypothetical protein EYR41_003603 [Orbilia oligospora]
MFPAAHSMAPYTNLNPISRLILVFRIDSRGPGSIAFQKAVKSLRWSRVLKREQREDVVWTRFVDVGGRRWLIFQSETFAFEDPVLPYWAKQDRTGSHPARMPGTRSISSERPFG